MRSSKEEDICDESVFNRVFRQHSRDLYQFLYYKFGPGNNPEDLVQEAFSKLWLNCAKVPLDKARSFLFTVASNKMLNEIDKTKTALKYADQSDRSDYNPETPAYQLEHDEFAEQLQSAINELTPEQRTAFLLNRVEGKPHKEIAEMLGISRKAVEKRIYGALKKLREKLDNPI